MAVAFIRTDDAPGVDWRRPAQGRAAEYGQRRSIANSPRQEVLKKTVHRSGSEKTLEPGPETKFQASTIAGMLASLNSD